MYYTSRTSGSMEKNMELRNVPTSATIKHFITLGNSVKWSVAINVTHSTG